MHLLGEASTLWLSTVRPDGRPHIVPVWFWWDGLAILVATRPNARKAGYIRDRPDCMVAVGDPEADFDIALIDAHAELTWITTATLLDIGVFEKYRDRMAAIGLSRAEFESTYSQVIRIVPTRWLSWRGRTHALRPAKPVLSLVV